jgi:signal transduction histidine kinase
VWPAGARTDYYPVTYYEPPTKANGRVLGYDVAVVANRREAQRRAILSGEPAVTEKIVLVRDRADPTPDPGFVFFLPIFRDGAPPRTPAQRERAVVGMLNSAFRATTFFQAVLGQNPVNSDIVFDLYDGPTPAPGSLLYSLRPDEERGAAGFIRVDRVAVGGRTWTLVYHTLPGFGSFWMRQGHWIVAAFGTLLSLLLFWLLWNAFRRAESERLLAAQVSQALDARDEFISIAAHELRTPITSLKMQLDMVRRYGSLDPAKSLEKVTRLGQQQVGRLMELINELLDVTRIQSGKLRVQRQETDLSQLVRDLVDHYRGSLPGADRLLELHAAPEPVLAQVDPLRFGQAVENLLSNAIKYGGLKPVQLHVDKDGRNGVIRVRDHGIGIPSDRQEIIFRRFERVADTDTVGGLGLGLYIAKQIVDAHQGRIRVESAPGQGSTFTIEIPLTSLALGA